MAHRVVWVIGAGFSQPLGAPLLADFFADEALTNVQGLYPSKQYPLLHDRSVSLTQYLYWWGRGVKKHNNAPHPRHLWGDAEEFLNRLDNAVTLGRESYQWGRLSSIVEAMSREPVDLLDIRAAARRLLVAECMAPFQDADLTMEHWQPFLRWGRELVEPQDTIIDFNYDMAPELIRDHWAQSGVPVRYSIQLPMSDMSLDPTPDHAKVLKLHGSVNWVRRADGSVAERHNAGETLQAADSELVLATPGSSKLKTAKSLDMLWRPAEKALTGANAIVFVGYRFPPTDTEACRRLMGAIANNYNSSLAVHIVLGPDVNKPETQSMQGMLRLKLAGGWDERQLSGPAEKRRYCIVVQPMYSQQFFLLADRGQILAHML